MLGVVVIGDELGDGVVVFDEEMCGNCQVVDFFEIGMFVWVQVILEECLDFIGVELFWWQVDIVDNQQ